MMGTFKSDEFFILKEGPESNFGGVQYLDFVSSSKK